MKKLYLLIVLFTLTSCRYFEKQVPDEDKLLQERLKEINWNEVTAYPSFPECDAITDAGLRKECFFNTLTALVQQKLGTDTLALMVPASDSILLKVTVFADATLKFEPQKVDSTTTQLDSIIKARLVNFPRVEPAQKEGVPVTSQFILPVILDVQQGH